MVIGPGTTLSQKYRLAKKLGEGGYGTVWLAENVDLGTKVAVKLVSPQRDQPDDAERLLREARLAATIDFPYVVRVLDCGRDGATGLVYMVMELLDGMSLRQLLGSHVKAQRPLRRDHVVQWLYQAFLGCAELHSNGIVHRDLKPENLFIDKSGRLKLIDLGISKGAQDKSVSNLLRGTPAYFAPELTSKDGRPTDRVDVWALAVVLYELLTLGRHPLIRDDEGLRIPHDQMFLRLAGAPILPLRARVPDVPADLAALVDLGLAREPQKRVDAVTALHVLERCARTNGWALPERPVFSRLQTLVTSKASALELADRTTIEHRPPGSSPVPPAGRVQVLLAQAGAPQGTVPIDRSATQGGPISARGDVAPSSTLEVPGSPPPSVAPSSVGPASAQPPSAQPPSAQPPSDQPRRRVAPTHLDAKRTGPTALDMSLQTPGPISTSQVLAGGKRPFPIVAVGIALVASFGLGLGVLRWTRAAAPAPASAPPAPLDAPTLVRVTAEPVDRAPTAEAPRHEPRVEHHAAPPKPPAAPTASASAKAAPTHAASAPPPAPPPAAKEPPPKSTQVGPLF